MYFHFTSLFAPISVRSSSLYLNQPSTMITKHQTPSQNDPKTPKELPVLYCNTIMPSSSIDRLISSTDHSLPTKYPDKHPNVHPAQKVPQKGKETHHLPKPSPPPSLPNPAIPLLHPPLLPPHKLFQPHNPQPRHQRGRIHRFPILAFACPRLFELDDFISTTVPKTEAIE